MACFACFGKSSSVVVPVGPDVFLGGSCNPTTWRKDVAIPMLTKAGVSFYNPQVDEWHQSLMALEDEAKKAARVLLFVLDAQTRGIASIAEASFYIGAGRRVVLVVQRFEGGAPVNGIQPAEFKDLNRGRAYLQDLARRSGTPVFETVQEAVAHVASLVKK